MFIEPLEGIKSQEPMIGLGFPVFGGGVGICDESFESSLLDEGK